MKKEEVVQIFENMGVEAYDGFNSNFKSLSQGMHFLTMLILKDLPQDARILCVGVGTGADIIDLAKMNEGWAFTGIEPSNVMLEGCKNKIKMEGLSERCNFFHGYLSEYNSDQKYDAVLCFFVFHFIDREERKNIFNDMNKYLKAGGHLVHAEISCDFESDNFPSVLNHWKALHGFAGADEERLSNMENMLKNQLSVLSPIETKELIQECGFKDPTQFFQGFLIRAFHSRKQ